MREVTCNKCGTVHMSLNIVELVNNLGVLPIHDQYRYCQTCGNSYTDFRDAVEADAPAGVTIQPILEYDPITINDIITYRKNKDGC